MHRGVLWIVLLLVASPVYDSVLYVAAACSNSGGTTIWPSYYSAWHTNTDATFYGSYTNGGACSLDPTPFAGTNGIHATVAVADNIWDGSSACGMCILIEASGLGLGATPLNGQYLVYVNNQCSSCVNSGIDLGLTGDGVWDINWKAVPCPVGSSKIQFKFAGSHEWYLKLQVRNSRYPVHKVSFLQGSTWKELKRTTDNHFSTEGASGITFPVSLPLSVRITATTGDVLQESISSIVNGIVTDGTQQFPDCSSSGPTTATATSSTTKSATSTSSTTKSATTTSSTTTSTTTSTTGKSSTTGSGSNSMPVYVDGFVSPFQDWSWAETNQVTTPVQAGTHAFSFVPDAWEAAYFYCAGCIKTSSHSSIEFYINSGSGTITNQLEFNLLRGTDPTSIIGPDLPITSYIAPATSLTPNTWIKGTVPLSNFPSGTYDGFWFQATGSTLARIYLDSIRVIGI